VFVYSVDPYKLLFTLSDVTELELADLEFSRCGSRLYTLSRATTKRLSVFSTATGAKLKGCDLQLPMRFDKISVYPGHKDKMALVRISSVRIVTMQKSYETYIMRLLPSPIPTDVDLVISAFSWTPTGHFLIATRQGTLCTIDGTSGTMIHACQVDQPITSIAVTSRHIVTVHFGNAVKFWTHDPHQAVLSGGGSQAQPLDMEGAMEGVYTLCKFANLERYAKRLKDEDKLNGQVAHLQVTPDLGSAVLTTAEGEVWSLTIQGLLSSDSGEATECSVAGSTSNPDGGDATARSSSSNTRPSARARWSHITAGGRPWWHHGDPRPSPFP
jgi:hypothetical protein